MFLPGFFLGLMAHRMSKKLITLEHIVASKENNFLKTFKKYF
jgi:hypothetical protein